MRAQLSLLHQRIILTFRFWFRLPIDDIKDEQMRQQFALFAEVNDRQVDAVQDLTKLVHSLHKRVEFYEQHIPRMRDLRRQFELQRLGVSTGATERQDDLEHGILRQ